MVIRIIVEGGVLPTNTNLTANEDPINTFNGSEVLREELKKFFTKVLGMSDVSVIVTYQGSYKNAAKVFISDVKEDFLYTDLDDVPEKRLEWFNKVEKDGISIPIERHKDVFFWIPEMEAWFLKQPQSIEGWANDNNINIKIPISKDSLLLGKDIEHLQHKPSLIMKVIFARDLENPKIGKNGKKQKLVYGKLRHAPLLLSYLNPLELINYDTELQSFVNRVKAKLGV